MQPLRHPRDPHTQAMSGFNFRPRQKNTESKLSLLIKQAKELNAPCRVPT
jgi:hypothetical protein